MEEASGMVMERQGTQGAKATEDAEYDAGRAEVRAFLARNLQIVNDFRHEMASDRPNRRKNSVLIGMLDDLTQTLLGYTQ